MAYVDDEFRSLPPAARNVEYWRRRATSARAQTARLLLTKPRQRKNADAA
jgi:hypothetical protein